MPRHVRTIGTVNRRHPLNRGRVAWWLCLPHLSGTQTWYDLMGSNHGKLTNMANASNGWQPTFRPGGRGQVLFDGSAGYVSIPSSVIGKLSLAAGATVAVWACPTRSLTEYDALFDATSGGQTGRQCSAFLGGSASQIYCAFAGTPGGGVSLSIPLSLGTWYRFAFAVTPTVTSVFVNGVLAGQIAQSGESFSAALVWIGGNPSTGGHAFGGLQDDFCVWSRALSAQEVLADYNLSRRGYPGVLNFRDGAVGRKNLMPFSQYYARKRRAA